MEIIHLPPQEAPKLITAHKPSRTLGEHMSGFLSHYAHCPDDTVYGGSDFKPHTTGSVLAILKTLHNRPQIRMSDIVKYANDIVRVCPGVQFESAKRIVIASFGFKFQYQLEERMVLMNHTVLDKRQVMTVFQSLFCHLVEVGQITKPSDVMIAELKPYAAVEFIAIARARIKEEQKTMSAYNEEIDKKLIEIENLILADRLVVLTEEQYRCAKTFSNPRKDGQPKDRVLLAFSLKELQGNVFWAHYKFNQYFMRHRKQELELKLARTSVRNTAERESIATRLEVIALWVKKYPILTG